MRFVDLVDQLAGTVGENTGLTRVQWLPIGDEIFQQLTVKGLFINRIVDTIKLFGDLGANGLQIPLLSILDELLDGNRP